MPTINDAFVNALLADASYVDGLAERDTGVDLKDKVKARITPALAEFISSNFEVASTIDTDDGAGSGFDATVWRGLAGTPYADSVYLSLRGTEAGGDFVADANLALASNAGRQIVDLINWWLRITTPTDGQAQQHAYTLEPLPDVQGQGLIAAGELSAGVFVNGHSLGGYLAAAFTRLFGTQANVLHTTTFNSAGFALGSEAAFTAIQTAIGAGLGRSFPGPGSPSQTNIFADNGINVTTNSLWFSQMGQRVSVFNEESTGIPNHYMYKLTDALALAAAMEKLDTSMTIDRANAIFEAGANQMAGSLEGVLDGLRRMLVGPGAASTPVGDTDGDAQTRVDYHTNLEALTTDPLAAALGGKVRIEPSGASLANVARTDFGALVALQTLSPVWVTGNGTDDAPLNSLWTSSAWSAQHDQWQSDKDLPDVERGLGKENYTDAWLASRADMLAAMVSRNERDVPSGAIVTGTTNTDYRDIQSGLSLTVRRTPTGFGQKVELVTFGGESGEALNGQPYSDRLFGGGGNDTLNGQGGNDHLEGNAGDDRLIGGSGNDVLLGGTGDDSLFGLLDDDTLFGGTGGDVYEFAGGFGNDVIKDVDMSGSVVVDGVVLTGANTEKIGESVWDSTDKTISYYVADRTDDNGVVHKDLRIGFFDYGAKQITIEDWTNGKLGISLPGRKPPIPPSSNSDYRRATTYRPRDPLAIDLDGDGIETVGIGANPILFDHNGDGVRTGTGWVRADDAWLALDRDGNGSIDSGLELFGVDTQITVNGVTRNAFSGFEALAALDSNADGVFDAADAQFAEARLWQDIDQDGQSQAAELTSLGQAGITSIGLTPTGGTVNLGNGNSITGQATVTRAGGANTTVGSLSVGGDWSASNLNLADNPFYRSFATAVPLIAQAAALPELGGSGWVRDLREAMSLGTSEAQVLLSTVTSFSTATSRAQQIALIDQLLLDWARTNQSQAVSTAWYTDTAPVNGAFDPSAGFAARLTQAMPIVEVFNGQTTQQSGTLFALTSATNTSTGQSGSVYVLFGLPGAFLDAYDTLRGAVYGSLVVQTRLRPYLSALSYVREGENLRADTAPLTTMLSAAWAADPEKALTDLIELNRYAADDLRRAGFDGLSVLVSWTSSLAADSPLWGTLASMGVLTVPASTGTANADIVIGTAGNEAIDGSAGDDSIAGAGGADTLYGGTGNDQLSGGDGSDSLLGGSGSDVLDGGADGDVLDGGSGNNVYLFGRGDGQDSIAQSSDPTAGKLSVLRFKAGVAPGDLVFTPVQIGASTGALVVAIAGTTDQMTINGFPGLDPTGTSSPVQRFEFADGTVWYLDDILASAFPGTAAPDNYRGTVLADVLRGQGGDDTLKGYDGDDVLDGGAGNDTLDGERGNNVYLFGRGDGQDTVLTYNDATPGKLNTLRFKAGIVPGDLALKQTPGEVLNNLRSVEVSITGTADKITISDFFAAADPLSPGNPIQQFEFEDGTVWDLAQILRALFAGTSGADVYEGSLRDDAILGQDGNDSISGGGYGNDTLDGGAGFDTLNGGFGNDTLIDGELMNGLLGSDTYVLHNWGTITINESIDSVPDSDLLVLPATSTSSTVQVIGRDVTNDGRPEHLVLKDAATGSEVTLTNYFLDPRLRVDSIQLGDGTSWTVADIGARDATHAGTAGNDTLYSYVWGGDVNGLDGNDTLWGYTGNDALYGGAGNDLLTGGQGADTLIGGDGNDSLDGDFSSLPTSNDGNDVLDGGAGSDTLFGGGGNDTYRFGRGRGADRVTDTAGANRIQLDAGIAPTDITLYREGLNLIVVVDQSATQLTIVDQFHASGARVASVEFADGTIWDTAAIQSRTVAGTPDAMIGTAGNDTFIVDDIGDTITEGVGQGADTVQSFVSYTLGANIENLTLTGYLNTNATGNALNNTITGNSSNNTLYGVDAADTLIGGAGDDTYRVNGASSTALNDYFSNDTIVEAVNGGIDTVVTSVYDFTLPDNVENLVSNNNWGRFSGATGAFIPRQLIGNALNNNIDANGSPVIAFGAYIDGGAGADTMRGTQENDTYIIDNLGDVVVEPGFTTQGANLSTSDTVISSISYVLGDWLEKITLTGNAVITATGNALNNVLDGSGNSAANVLAGGMGDDTYRVGLGDTVMEAVGEGVDTLMIAAGGLGSYQLSGYANVENISLDDAIGASSATGDAGDNRVVGNRQNNTLIGGAGNDVIVDGPGPYRDAFGNLVQQNDNDTLQGGDGDDDLQGNYGSDVLDGGAGNDTMAGSGSTTTVAFGHGFGADRWTAFGSGANRRIAFNADVDITELQVGRAGADLTLSVGAGDTLTVVGFFVDAASQATNDQFGALQFADGTALTRDQVMARLASGNTSTATAGDDLIIGTPAADVLSGLAGSDAVYGGAGDDTLAGNAGADILAGGTGNDTYLFGRGDGQDVIREADGAADAVLLALDVAPADAAVSRSGNDLSLSIAGSSDRLLVQNFFVSPTSEIELVRFADGTVWDNATLKTMASQITGTSGADSLTGGSSADRIYGLAGNDTLSGLDGDDLLDGGTGNDSMVGGLGNDTFVVDSATDTVNEATGQGTDTVQSSVTFTLPSTQNVENLTLTGTAAINATGNTLANVLTGNAGNNTLSGGTGADTLIGGAGNDTYVVDNTGDAVTELAGEGTDLVQSSVSITALAANVENLALTGSSGLSGTGNELDNVLTGNSGANRLAGGAGNDRLDGGSGTDTLVGGTGDDTYVVNVSTDVVTELAGEGTDTIESTVTLTLGSGNTVENLRLLGSSAISATGNGLANVLTGNSANNTLTGNAGDDTLDGGAGTDTLRGGAGNDTYVVERSADVTTENANEGTDTVLSSVTRTLGSNLENLTLTGSSAINGTGNTLANVLIGNSAANTLAGVAGNDTYDGGTGNDALTDNSTTSNEIYRWGIGYGVDTVSDSGGTDRVEIGAGITAAQIVFSHVGNNLEVTVSGNSADKLVISNHYVGTANRIESFQLSDGSIVSPSQIPLSVASRQFAATDASADPALDRQQIMPIRAVVEATAAAPSQPAYRLPWKLWSLRDDMLLEPAVAAPGAGVTDAIMLGQAHSLVSAMAAFGAGDQVALQSERQTIMPVRVEPLWVSPAVM